MRWFCILGLLLISLSELAFIEPIMHEESFEYATFYGPFSEGGWGSAKKVFDICGVDRCTYRSRPLGYLGEWADAKLLYAFNRELAFGFRSLVQSVSLFLAALLLFTLFQRMFQRPLLAFGLSCLFLLSTQVLAIHTVYFRSAKSIAAAIFAALLAFLVTRLRENRDLSRRAMAVGMGLTAVACLFDEQVPAYLLLVGAGLLGLWWLDRGFTLALRFAQLYFGALGFYLVYHLFIGPRLIVVTTVTPQASSLSRIKDLMLKPSLIWGNLANFFRQAGLMLGNIPDAFPLWAAVLEGMAVASVLALLVRMRRRLPGDRNARVAAMLCLASLGLVMGLGLWHPPISWPSVSRMYYFQPWVVIFLVSVIGWLEPVLQNLKTGSVLAFVAVVALINIASFRTTFFKHFGPTNILELNAAFQRGDVEHMGWGSKLYTKLKETGHPVPWNRPLKLRAPGSADPVAPSR